MSLLKYSNALFALFKTLLYFKRRPPKKISEHIHDKHETFLSDFRFSALQLLDGPRSKSFSFLPARHSTSFR